jgi:hypothetical protein
MQRAAGIGAAVANSRGLQNSSIAAQSAQKAALDAAVPIASQEAQQAHQRNLQVIQGQQQTDLQRVQNEGQLATQRLQNEGQLATQQAQSQNQSQIAQLQADTQRLISAQQTAAASQGAFSQALLAASQSYSANVSAIMSNPDLKEAARQAALNDAAAQRNSDYAMIQKVYGVSLSGSSGGTGGTGGTGGIGGTGGSGLTGWAAYLQQYPDVAANYANVNHKTFPTPESYAQWHYEHYGQQEGRQAPSGTSELTWGA